MAVAEGQKYLYQQTRCSTPGCRSWGMKAATPGGRVMVLDRCRECQALSAVEVRQRRAEALVAPGSTIAEALADRSKPLKIGLNIWLTDRPDWGR